MATGQKAVVLLSGGLDSATVLAIALSEGYDVHPISFRYGQRHVTELQMASRLVTRHKLRSHIIIDIDLRQFGGSALTADIDVPRDRTVEEMASGIPITYVPARNTIFLSFALAHAEALSAFDIFIGVNALDYSGYPDCRPEYIAAFEAVANLATKAGVEESGHFRVHTPLISLTKSEIIRTGLDLGVDYLLTSTCYEPDPETGIACGKCDACVLRLRGFAEIGQTDPIKYRQV